MLEGPVEFNSITINDQTNGNLHLGYWIRLTSVDGLFGDEIRYESHPIPSGTGERSASSFRSGKQLVLTGEIWAKGLAELRIGEQQLMQMFWDLQPYKLYYHSFELGSQRLYITCRCNQPLVITDQFQKLNYFIQSWTVGLRADDPRSYKEADNSVYPTFQT